MTDWITGTIIESDLKRLRQTLLFTIKRHKEPGSVGMRLIHSASGHPGPKFMVDEMVRPGSRTRTRGPRGGRRSHPEPPLSSAAAPGRPRRGHFGNPYGTFTVTFFLARDFRKKNSKISGKSFFEFFKKRCKSLCPPPKVIENGGPAPDARPPPKRASSLATLDTTGVRADATPTAVAARRCPSQGWLPVVGAAAPS